MSSNFGDKGNAKKSLKTHIKNIVGSGKLIDLLFSIFCLYIIINYIYFITALHVPFWDGAVFLLNAHEWLDNINLTEIYRPPLLSWIMDGIWLFTGEDWTTVKYVQMVFTMTGIILLYGLLRRKKGALFAFGVSALTLSNAQLFFQTSQIRTEGISLFFVILTLYFLDGTKRTHWLLSGISIGLTFASRYPVLLQSIIIFIVESILKRDPKSTAKATIVIISVILLVISIVFAKTGTFQVALEKDSNFGTSFTPFYIENALGIWGPAILLLPIAFLFKSTFKDKLNYVFMGWFILSLLAWSTNESNHQYRFTIQFMPAAYFLVILTIENLIRLDRNNLIFLKNSDNKDVSKRALSKN